MCKGTVHKRGNSEMAMQSRPRNLSDRSFPGSSVKQWARAWLDAGSVEHQRPENTFLALKRPRRFPGTAKESGADTKWEGRGSASRILTLCLNA